MPQAPFQQHDEHILKMPHKKRRSQLDGQYLYEDRRLLPLLHGAALRGLALTVMPVWARLAVDYRIVGMEHLRALDGQGAILVANHVHFLDAPILCACLHPARKIRYIMLGENVDIPVVGGIIKALGGIPIPDNLEGMKAFTRTIYRLLDEKKLLLFFPEAVLWPHYRGVRKFHKGCFTYAVRRHVPVLPMMYTFEQTAAGRERLVLTIAPAISSEGKTPQALLEETHACFARHMQAFYGPEQLRLPEKAGQGEDPPER